VPDPIRSDKREDERASKRRNQRTDQGNTRCPRTAEWGEHPWLLGREWGNPLSVSEGGFQFATVWKFQAEGNSFTVCAHFFQGPPRPRPVITLSPVGARSGDSPPRERREQSAGRKSWSHRRDAVPATGPRQHFLGAPRRRIDRCCLALDPTPTSRSDVIGSMVQ